jgi:hypothetical protein
MAELVIDDYSMRAASEATYGVLRAAAELEFSDAEGDRLILDSISSAEFEDTLFFDSPGLTGQSGFADISFAMVGMTAASASGTFIASLASVQFNLWVGSDRGGFDRFLSVSSGGSIISRGEDTDSGTLRVPVVFGQDGVDVRAILSLDLTSTGGTGAIGSGAISGLYDNSAGVTRIDVFDVEMNPVDFSLESESGEFSLLVVPEPASNLLHGVCLAALALSAHRNRRRRPVSRCSPLAEGFARAL